MLTGDFSNISTMSSSDGRIVAVLEINTMHKIFDGHFPGQPVVPGVCMLQMVKEVLEKELGNATRLTNADYLKFLTIINPAENNIIHVEIKYVIGEDRRIIMSATLLNELVIYFKMKGVMVIDNLTG